MHITFKVDDALFSPFNLDRLIRSLIALEFCATGRFVADETLLALQHENWSVDKIEEVFAVVVNHIGSGEEMTGPLGDHVTTVVCSKGN